MNIAAKGASNVNHREAVFRQSHHLEVGLIRFCIIIRCVMMLCCGTHYCLRHLQMRKLGHTQLGPTRRELIYVIAQFPRRIWRHLRHSPGTIGHVITADCMLVIEARAIN
jgi:hypothetical protein